MRWLRSFAPRVALLMGAVVLVASVLGAGWGWLRAQDALRRQLDLVLAADAEGLLRDYETYGLRGLAEAAAVYARRQGPLRVLLLGPDGRPIAGHLPGAPARLRGFVTLEGEGERQRLLGAILPDGTNLLVGTDLEPVDRAAAALAWTPPVAAALAAALALVLGFLVARRLEARLAGIRGAAQAVMAGDLTRRLPEGGAGDEFDRLAGTVNAMLARIEALVAELRQVTDDIAHDLRSPLSRLRQRLEAALFAPREAAADAATLEAAIAELDETLNTFAALLRIARAEAGTGREAFAPVDLSALVREVCEIYAGVAEEAGRVLDPRIAPGQKVAGSATLLRQALANLLDNALNHGEGRITVTLEAGPVLGVTDEGPGIPEAERNKVLRRFYRLDRSRNTPGTGLGLALVSAIARLHGGGIRLQAAGRGTRVIVDFRPGAMAAVSRPRPAGAAGTTGE
ncbi:sensor histidine kinase [Teichococcus vastitatis]|uniref:histidine kinase n=1 Tax=Teichococcus vastitatis TaxID=2307076 RepID=A0ABS9WDF3_9PROT|nr:HAMP domain-containing sensor histidine kinase [Pseudoroseomonas vastitatis]MCI0756780.1 HAMP domain-containing histidine kinase [Pseudoroseomonas vastitatis]